MTSDAPTNLQPDASGMLASGPERRAKGRLGALLCHVAAGLLIVAHFAFLMAHFEPAIATPDANGYFAQATRIAREGRTWFVPESPLTYVGGHWLTPDGQKHFSRYPPGYPAILAVAFKLGGPAACLVVPAAMASLTLLALYLLCARWIGPGWGLLAVALMAVNPIANEHALYQFAHTPVAFFLVWGLYFLARWEGSPAWFWALAGGLCFGVIPSVRYPGALFLPAVALFVLVLVLKQRKRWRSAVVGVAAVAVPLLLLAIRNQLAFGAFWKTGYALTNEQTGFGWDYFYRSWMTYIIGLQGQGAGILFGLGLAGMAAMTFRRKTWHRGVLLALLVVPLTLLYMAYYWGGGRAQATMRFMVPTFFVYAIAGVWLLSHVRRLTRGAVLAAGLALVIINAVWGLPASRERLRRLEQTSSALASLTRSLHEHVEPGSLLIAGPGIQQHLDFVGDWKLVDETVLLGLPGGRRMMDRRRNADPDAPSPRQPEKLEARDRQYEGLYGMDRLEAVVRDLWTWAGKGRKVYWIGEEAQIDRFEAGLGRNWPDRLITVATIELPQPEEPERDRFGGVPPTSRGRVGRSRRRDERRDDRRPAMDRRPPRGRGGPMGGLRGLAQGGTLVLVEWTVD